MLTKGKHLQYKYFAIDFDGTIAHNAFPEIGDLIPFADAVIREIRVHGGKIAIWTCRTGEQLEKVKYFLALHDIPYDVINEAFPDVIRQWNGDNSRKIFADVYIDDRSLHAIEQGIDWLDIARKIFST